MGCPPVAMNEHAQTMATFAAWYWTEAYRAVRTSARHELTALGNHFAKHFRAALPP